MIKFRAWDKESQRLFDVARFDFADYTVYSHLFACDGYLGENLEIMQSTGIKDKNGVEIFEGDILKVNEMIGLVKFGRYTDGEYIIYGLDGWLFIEKYRNRFIDTSLTEYVLDSDYEVEVVGNKFEHSHLLEGDNE